MWKDIEKDEGRVEPVLKEAANTRALDWGLEAFQNGVLDFVRDFSQTLQTAGISPSAREREEILETALLNYTNPTRDFASVMGDFPYAWDPSHAYLQKLAGEITVGDYCAYLRSDSYAQCRITYWLAGSLARSRWSVRVFDRLISFVRRSRFSLGVRKLVFSESRLLL
jgi:hypothetical protein